MEFPQTVSTETWRVLLPDDWVQPPSPSRENVYFESGDGSKGAYFSTWRFDGDTRSAPEILESIHQIEVSSFYKMEGRSWSCRNEWRSGTEAVAASGVDYVDAEHSYRIICQLLASLPWVVRASFHDYDCVDYEASRDYFATIIHSLRIHDADEA